MQTCSSMSHTETAPTGQIMQALADADPSVAHLMRAYGLDTLDQVFRFVPHEASMAALSAALTADDAAVLGEIVGAFQRYQFDKAIDDLSDDPSAVQKMYGTGRCQNYPSYKCYTGATLITRLANKEHVESLAVVVRHTADRLSSIKESIRELAFGCSHPRPNLHALRILLDVCANEPKIDPETQTQLLVDALVLCAGEFAHDIIDTLAPMCTLYVLHETLLRCAGDGARFHAFDNIWRIADGIVCVHRMAKDLRGGDARVRMRRCIRDLGKGRPCKSVDCIYGPSCASARPEPPSPRALVHQL
nr:hypothetical protein [Pandoravirus belohorizontensis]